MARLGLAWVLVAGRPRSVSEFAALPPRRRPRPSCPLCGRRLTLKLGRIRRHHAAHAPNDVCRATQPETALHIDTKLYLAAQLAPAIASDPTPTLVIRRRCEGTPLETCDAVRDECWAEDWDEVVIEAGGVAEARLRPDILLSRNGVPIAAIEVLVSHRVPDEKAAALEDAGLPWIEIRADPGLLEGDAAVNLVEEALLDVHPGDPMPLATRYPRRWYFARARGRWFLPAEMRDVRWDRPEHDVFAAHPAWTASRAVVRERPVPEHAWNGVIFASRTSATAFGASAAPVPNEPIAVVTLDCADVDQARRALVVLTAAVDDTVVRGVERSLDAEGIEHVWLSHPRDWKGSRSDLPWAAAARDERGRHVVLVDGVGVFRASAFAEAFRRGDAKVRPAAVRARMLGRVSGLRGER